MVVPVTTREHFRKLRAEHWRADHWQAGRVDMLAAAIDGLHEWRFVAEEEGFRLRIQYRAYLRALETYRLRPATETDLRWREDPGAGIHRAT